MATAIRDEIKTASITPERLGTLLVGLVSAIGAGGSSSGGDKADVLGTVLSGFGDTQRQSSVKDTSTVLQAISTLSYLVNNGRFKTVSDGTGFLLLSSSEAEGTGTVSGLRITINDEGDMELRASMLEGATGSKSWFMMGDETIMGISAKWPLVSGENTGGTVDVLGTMANAGSYQSNRRIQPSDNIGSVLKSLTAFTNNGRFSVNSDETGLLIASRQTDTGGVNVGLRLLKKENDSIELRGIVTTNGVLVHRLCETESNADEYVSAIMEKSRSWPLIMSGEGSGSGNVSEVLGTVLSGFGDSSRQFSVKDTSTVLQAISTLSYLVNNGRFKTVSDGTGFLLLSSSEAEGSGTVSGLRVAINSDGGLELRASKLEGATGSKSWFLMGDETIMGISAQWPLVSGGGIGIKNVTFDELKAAVEAGTLETGYRYRLTDYECKTSSGHPVEHHPFNIVFEAVSPSNLSEYACAERKEDDEYYTSNDLSKWKIKFSFDAAGYDWVTADSGFKGVIYYMKDEYGNSAGYDFKQIKVGNTSRLSNIYYKDGLAGNKSKVAQAVADMLYSSASDIIVCGQRYGSSSISGDYKKAGVSGGASVLPSSSQYVKLFGESENAIVAAVANTAVGVGESTSVYAFGGDTKNDYSISGITRNCHVGGHGPRGNVFKNVCTNCSIGENVSNSVLSGDYITVDGNSVGNILFGDRLAVHDGNRCHILGNSSGIEIESSTDVAMGSSCDRCSASSVSFAGIGGNCGNVAVSDMEIFLCNGICVDLDISGIDSLIIGANSSGIRSLGSSFTQVNEIPAYSKGIVIMNRTQPLSYSELGFVPSETERLQNLLVTDGDAAGVLSDLTGLTDTYFKILRGSSIIPSRPDSELSGTSENPVQNKAIKGALDKKQDTLVSSMNIKTLNGLSLLGTGGIVVEDKQLYTLYSDVPEDYSISPGQIWIIDRNPDTGMSMPITVNKVSVSSSIGEPKVSLMNSYIYASDNLNFVFNAASVLNFAVYKKDFGNPPGKGGKRKYTLNWVTKGTSQFVVIDCENFE